ARSSVKAIEQGLAILKDGAVMSICIYYGRNNGYDEKDAVLAFLSTLDAAAFTVIVHHFHNRGGDVAIPVSVIKQG
ncbi:MAG: SAM-dependent methyltransferase, partial [Oscillospiraceae bacterium]|nr:SAM-dependent methyltransferase [Oscillospiraceae bacterium]